MTKSMRTALVLTAGIALLGMSGCATSEQLEALRGEVQAAQETADNAMARANAAYDLASQANANSEAAMADAEAAAAAAAAADAKAERIYTESLRK